METRNRLAELRAERGVSAAQLANTIGISRQTVYAIEAGSYVPNTSVSLKIACVLDVSVEEIFQLQEEPSADQKSIEATLLPTAERALPGQPLRLCVVNGNAVAVCSEPSVLGISVSEGTLLSGAKKGVERNVVKVGVADESWKSPDRLLIAGCDPSVPFVQHHLSRLNIDLLVSYQNSSSALELLKQDLVHIAGTHLVDKTSGEFDLARIKEIFGKSSVAVICYATWEEGLTVAKGNPKRISGIADLVRKDVKIVNREVGAACRKLLESLLREKGIRGRQVAGYDDVAFGHMPAARMVQTSQVDCCITTRAAARVLGLDFIPLARRPYHLITRKKHLALPTVQAMLNLFRRASFRREVEASTGYDMKAAGNLLQ